MCPLAEPLCATKMNDRIAQLLVSICILTGCQVNPSPNDYVIIDETKLRPYDSTLSDFRSNASIGQIQQEYNDKRRKQLKSILGKLNLTSLKDLKSDTSAYRLIVDHGWSGSPLAFTIYKSADSAFVQSVALRYDIMNSRNTSHLDPVRLQLDYKISIENFHQLDSVLSGNGLWEDYSFEANDGWFIFDNSQYFVEGRSNSRYKLICRERDEIQRIKKILIPFFKATNYNDSIAILLEND